MQHHRPTRRRPDYHTTYRVKANVTGSRLLALDSDTEDVRSDFDTLLADPFIGHYAALLHATASSTGVPPHPHHLPPGKGPGPGRLRGGPQGALAPLTRSVTGR